jgi:hypothetical protein
MRFPSVSILATALFFAVGAHADDYIKDGKLTQPLKITQLQGGFAGFTGTEFSIGVDGAWSMGTVFRQKTTPKAAGQLSKQELESLAAVLKKYDLEKLPAKAGKQPGANPNVITIDFGKTKATLTGQTAPKVNANDPAGSVESRFAGILQGVKDLCKEAGKKDADKE